MNIRDVLIIGAIILVLGGVLYLLGGKNGFRWYESYRPGTEEPYHTGLIENRLRQFSENELSVVDTQIDSFLLRNTDRGQTYFFADKNYYADSNVVSVLLDFVARGNTAFISTGQLPYQLTEQIDLHYCDEYELGLYETRDTLVRTYLMHPDLAGTENSAAIDYAWPGARRPYNWKYLSDGIFCAESDFTPLGYLTTTDDEYKYINFARQQHGDGIIYLHTTPLALTNYHLLTTGGQQYADALLAHLPSGAVIYDRESQQPGLLSFFDSNNTKRDTPLRFILQQPALAWAWYVLLAGVLLYLLFRAKRRQRIIPVLPTNRNTSLEYIQTVGRLYFLQENHKKLALQQVKILLQFIHERYGLATSQLDDKFFANLAVRSGVPREHIETTFRLYQNIRTSGFVSDNTLTKMHRLIERFYQES